MIVTVTGADGFIGRALLGHLTDLGTQCVAVGRSPTDDRIPGVDYKEIDIKNASKLQDVAHAADVVVHLAATIYSKEDEKLFLDNAFATYIVSDVVKRAGKRLIFASTTAVYGGPNDVGKMSETSMVRPRTAYAMSKYLSEQAIVGATMDATILRLTYVSGGDDTKSQLARVVASVAREKRVRFVDEHRDVVDVDDAVRAISSCLEYEGQVRIFNIGTGRLLSLHDAGRIAMEILERHVPMEILGSRPGFVVDAERARNELDWAPTRHPEDIIRALCVRFE